MDSLSQLHASCNTSVRRDLTNATEAFDHPLLEQHLPPAVGYGHTERCMLVFADTHLDVCSSSRLVHTGPSDYVNYCHQPCEAGQLSLGRAFPHSRSQSVDERAEFVNAETYMACSLLCNMACLSLRSLPQHEQRPPL